MGATDTRLQKAPSRRLTAGAFMHLFRCFVIGLFSPLPLPTVQISLHPPPAA